MYKVSIELLRISGSLKVKFSVVVKNDESMNKKFPQEIVHKFTFKGNTYLNITPFPYVTIDISKRNDEFSTNLSFNLNRRDLYLFIVHMNVLLKKFIEKEELFYYEETYEGKRLKVNRELADSIKEVVICGGKTILVQPCVVSINDGKRVNDYEGVILSINDLSYYTYLTYADLKYLVYELNKIDMTSLATNVINTAILYEKNASDDITKEIQKEHGSVYNVEEIEKLPERKVRTAIKEPDTIPKI